jgi:hypothetical protein
MPGGNFTGDSIYRLSDPFNDALEQRTVPDFARADLLSNIIAGAVTVNQPTDEIPEAKVGLFSHDFAFLDYYNRIHYSERLIDLGNVISEQTRELRIFNAYFVPQILNTITAVDDEGIILTQPAGLPLTYAPLAEKTYSFAISATGPPNVDSTFTFTFDVLGATDVRIIGTRIIAWTFAADWSREIRETLTWATDVMPAYDGSEQRAGLRTYPRQGYEFTFTVTGRDRRECENSIYGWGGRVWALPLWADGVILQSAISGGVTNIAADTVGRQFREGGLAILLTPARVFEVIEIETVNEDSIDLVRPLGGDWPATSALYPAISARLGDQSSISRFTGDAGYGIALFTGVDPAPYEAATEAATYRGYPVMPYAPEWSIDPTNEFARKMAILDTQTGPRAYDDESGLASQSPSYRWICASRAEIDDLRKFFYARKGKLKSIWVPSWVDDLIVVVTIGAASTNIDVEYIGYDQLVGADDSGRRDLRIELTDGQIFYRRVTGSSVIDDETERLSISTALGTEVLISEIRQVSFMSLMRLESDQVEFTYWTGDSMESTNAMRSFRNVI